MSDQKPERWVCGLCDMTFRLRDRHYINGEVMRCPELRCGLRFCASTHGSRSEIREICYVTHDDLAMHRARRKVAA